MRTGFLPSMEPPPAPGKPQAHPTASQGAGPQTPKDRKPPGWRACSLVTWDQPGGSRVRQTGDDTMEIRFDEPQRAVTKGQAVVLYDGDTVVGGGTIC